jgi:hypothetical protein
MNMGPKADPVQGGVKGEKGASSGYDTAMETIISIREAFNSGHFDPNDPDDAKVIRYMERKKNGNANEQGVAGTDPNVQAIRPTDYKAVTAAIPFDDRSAVLSPTGRQVLAGEEARYDPGIWFNSAKFFDVEYQTYGNVDPRAPDDASLWWEHVDGRKGVRLAHADGRLTGVNVMGIRWRHAVCERWIAEGRALADVLPRLGEAEFDAELSARHADEIARALAPRLPGPRPTVAAGSGR